MPVVYISKGKVDKLHCKLKETFTLDDPQVASMMEVILECLDCSTKKHAEFLEKQRKLMQETRSQIVRNGGTNYTESDRKYYVANKERLNAERTERGRRARGTARAEIQPS
jgi:hypothetical protein